MAFLILFGWFAPASAACPSWLKEKPADIPKCPAGKNPTLIPETYPIGAIVVSDATTGPNSKNLTADIVVKVLQGAGKNTPLILLPVSDESLATIKKRVDNLPASPQEKNAWKSALQQVKAESFRWQQDYMQPFVDPQSGKVILREISGYQNTGFKDPKSFEKIAKASEECGFGTGSPLETTDPYHGGFSGGNIETLPAGICLLGDSFFPDNESYQKYAGQICGNSPNDRIKVPTSWLQIGHVDEIMKVVRDNRQKAPCDFSVVVASPKKALDLIKDNPKEAFTYFPKVKSNTLEAQAKKRMEMTSTLRKICREVETLRSSPRLPDQNKRHHSKGISKLIDFKSFLTLTWAFAGTVEAPPPPTCDNLSNGEAYEVLSRDSEFMEFNNIVQVKMDEVKKDVAAKLKAKLPQCKIDFLDAPDLFSGGSPVNEKYDKNAGKGMSLSVLPNPTNSISINNTIISPEPQNSRFKKYLQEEYAKRGLKSEFVDTFEETHLSHGNLHCISNVIPVCSPNEGQ